MHSIRPVIAGNGLAIILTVVFLLPTTAVVAFVATGPIDDFFANNPISVYPNPPGSWIPEDSPGSESATFTGLTPGVSYTFK